MPPTWQSDCGRVTLYQGDCLSVLPGLGRFDALVTDPPYGIGEAAGKNKSRGDSLVPSRDYGNAGWDDAVADIGPARQAADHQIIFGGNYYDLPPSPCWLIWDKLNGRNDFADCEMAWTNLPKAARLLRFNVARDASRQQRATRRPPDPEAGSRHAVVPDVPARRNRNRA